MQPEVKMKHEKKWESIFFNGPRQSSKLDEKKARLPYSTKKESGVKPKHSKDSRTPFRVRWLDTAFFLSMTRKKAKNADANLLLKYKQFIESTQLIKCIPSPYTLPSGIWPTPPKNAKKGRNNAKALGHRLLAKRPRGQAGFGGAILAFLRSVAFFLSSSSGKKR